MSIYIHPATQKALTAFQTTQPQAMILSGKEGVGLSTLAAHLVAASGKIQWIVLPEKDERIDLEKGTITIASIRRLYDLTKTIEPKGRVVIIDYAERMAIPAQNAFLKLLEEPTEGTQFILLTHQPDALLPTVHSRAQHIMVRPIEAEATAALLDELGVDDATQRTQLLFIASGFPAEITRLVHDEAAFDKRSQIVKDARTFVTAPAYERLIIAQKYKNDRRGALMLLEDAARMLQSSLARDGAEKTLQALRHTEVLHKRISEQGNIRLQLSSALVLSK